jgi:hypothetical protein
LNSQSPRRAGVAAICVALGLLALAAPAASASVGLTATDTVAGGTIQATAQLTGAPDAAGTISFEVFGPGDPTCSGPALTPAPAAATVTGEGDYASGSFAPPGAGTYRWSARYSDGVNPPEEAFCAAASTVDKASPSLSGSASAAVVGTAIGDVATLSGGFSPTGEVTFSVYAPGDDTCSSPLDTDTVPLVLGQASSPSFAPQQAGEFRWRAFYLGDANNLPANTACGAANQTSVVSKASPALSGTATSVIFVGQAITDSANLAGGFSPTGQLTFRLYGPDDPTCAGAVVYQDQVAIAGSGPHSPDPFTPTQTGAYHWTLEYEGDANNLAATLPCGTDKQTSAVGVIGIALSAAAANGTVGSPLTATATIAAGAIPGGQLSFKAFAPGDASCSGAPASTSTVPVAGNGTYRSAALTPSRVGTYRWTVAYSGDPNHAAASVGCGAASSVASKAIPTIAGKVGRKLTVGTRFRDTVSLLAGFAPTGTITFAIYAPGDNRCAKPAYVNTVPVNGTGTYRSDPFVAKRAGHYRFVATYSGDAANQQATEPCGALDQIAKVRKRTPKLRPRALVSGLQISIRARLSGTASPAGLLTFRLYGPDSPRCTGKPAFTGGLRVNANGTVSLAEYIATRPGTYRLALGYSGDARNARSRISCAAAQTIVVRISA